MHEKYTQAKQNELKILNFLLYEKSGETVLKTSTRKDQSSTSFPLSSICLNGPFYCFELVIRRRNSVIILYFFFFLGPFRGSVAGGYGSQGLFSFRIASSSNSFSSIHVKMHLLYPSYSKLDNKLIKSVCWCCERKFLSRMS